MQRNHKAAYVLWGFLASKAGKNEWHKVRNSIGIRASHILESCKLEDPLTSGPKIQSVHTAAKLVANMLHVCLSLQIGVDICIKICECTPA